jgi:uncharacterized protein YeaO (DUF488 family)
MSARPATIAIKRVYDSPAESDGVRLLVDRLWPRGLKKEEARIDEWLRDLAPSNELRKWFHGHRDKWPEFRRKYLQELRSPGAAKALAHLEELLSDDDHVTLLFASQEADQNNAVILKEVLEGTKNPPHTSRPTSAPARMRKTRRPTR